MIRFDLRNNSLIILLVAVYLALLVMGVITFDRQYYQTAKKLLLEELYLTAGFLDDLTLEAVVEEFLRASTPKEQTRTKSLVLKKTKEYFATRESLPVLSIRVVREGKTLIETLRSPERNFNTPRNSLVLRDFHGSMKINIGARDEPGRKLGVLVLRYTTPVGFIPVEELTRRYWVYLALLVSAFTAACFQMLRLLILPIKKVTEAIQQSPAGVARFIAKPRSRLERLYNVMARDALLNALTVDLGNPASRRLRATLNDLLETLAPRVARWFGFRGVWLFDLGWEGPAKVSPVRQLPADKNGPPAWESVAAAFGGALARNLRTSWEAKTPQLFHARLAEEAGQVFSGVVVYQESVSAMRVLVMLGRRPADAEQAAWYRDTAEKVYRQVLGLVERQTGQSRELLREKGEANISLSRNLGHDLTNIIATNKLELMTVRSLLDGDPSTWFDHAEKIAILKESLTCLLDNTRSLQQIVNLYRAYEHLKSPRYERTEINPLIEELIAIFHLSMSAPVDIVCDFAKGLPCVEIEPRLVKLALFNLLSNAQDAIRRLPPEEQSGARIVVQTLADPSRPDVVTVRVSDTGPGIRTPDGSLAAAEEIDRVFELGYTTKGSEGGEGIGLNWVRTILTEFHPSELIAYNRPQGGATFQFRLPAARNATESLASKEGPGR